ncbi:ABC transporter ATP-binding protein [Nocardioides xinjiangensis]|uniref:ABC transporter ATP-binding protein n=1 Tax=Nocardioides xinjiangensis TaxID=2817376 RepID=UPI0027DDA38B|nr:MULTISPECIES: ABC transporter ATP-binding protein [unclassified Nocardioides]
MDQGGAAHLDGRVTRVGARSSHRVGTRRFGALGSVRRAWRRLSPFFRGSRAWLALLVVLAVSAGLLEASVLALIAAMAVSLSEGSARTSLSIGPVGVGMSQTVTFVVAISLTVARTLLQLALAYLPARMSAQVMADLRIDLFDAFAGTAWSTKARERDGAFQTLMTQNVTNVASAVIGLGNGLTATIMFVMMVVVALLQNALAAGVLAVAAVVLFAALRPLARVLRRNAKRLSGEAMSFTERVQDVVLVAEETEVFGATPTYVSGFHRQVDAVRRPHARTRFLSGALPALYQSVALIMLVVALIGVALSGATDLAALAAVILLLIRALTYAQQIQTAVTNIDERIPFMDQIADALERYRGNPQQDGPEELGEVRSLRMEEVCFSYRPGTEVLRDVSFEVRRGEAIGIVGPSGAGKSSIVQLLLRLREPSAGAVLVDDRDVAQVRRDQWRRGVAYVPQTSQLVWGTVRDNIRFYRDWIDDDQVERAARRAHIHDDIMSWPDGYATRVGQRVGAVSGGQRQRICLARALADEPQVLVLDEPTSALDVRSEDAVAASLHELKADTILVLVAHRLSTLSMCDRIVVMVDGRVSAVGSHDDLVDHDEFFREVYEITQRQRQH